MSIAWTTVIIVILLLPGLSFLLGYAAHERYSRELVRSNAIVDVGIAVFCAVVAHFLALTFIWKTLGADPSFYYAPLLDYEHIERSKLVAEIYSRLWPTLSYVILLTAAAFFVGYAIAWVVMFGPLRRLATHKWAYDLLKEVKRGGVVTASVMTNIVDDKKILMYVGHLEEFYLESNGTFSYIVLKNCFRFYMKLDEAFPTLGERASLFTTGARRWEHLTIEGGNIANVLFDPVGDLAQTPEGTRALDAALAGQPIADALDAEG